MKLRVHVRLKEAVLDPQGQAVLGALRGLGFTEVEDVRIGRVIDLDIADGDRDAAIARADRMCQALLANTVIEDYQIEAG